MKATGIIRQVDELGRIVIPIETRQALDIKPKDPLEIFVDEGGRIILQKYQPGCVFCKEAGDVVMFDGAKICRKCLEEIKSRF